MRNKLKATQVSKWTKPGKYADGGGLYLWIREQGTKAWVFRKTIKGKAVNKALGIFPVLSLADAREKALEFERQLLEGDPAKLDVPVFSDAIHKRHNERKGRWKNGKHAQQWINTLVTYAVPYIGHKQLDEVTKNDIYEILIAIWDEKPETAKRVKQRLTDVFDWAESRGWVEWNPVTSAAKGLPQQRAKVQHHASVHYGEVAGVLEAVRGGRAFLATKLAFEFLVLVAGRSGEVRLARWDEFDLEEKVWSFPAERMKMDKPHRVPLSPKAIQILEEVKALRTNDIVFPSKHNKTISDMTFSKLMRDLNINAVPHGFRTSFRTWAQEQTDTEWEVAEAALAHAQKNKVAAAYARSDYFEKRVSLMTTWDEFLNQAKRQ